MSRTLPQLTAMCTLALFSFYCGPDQRGILVHVRGLTPDINKLQVNAILDDKPAKEEVEFVHQLSQFTIEMPTSNPDPGILTIDVTGIGNDHCQLSTGRIDTEVNHSNPYAELELDLVPLQAELCTLINRITPLRGPNTGGTILELTGKNFAQGTTVTIAGVAASKVTVTAPDSLTAVLPPQPGTLGNVPVVVRTPDGQSASRSDLFSYYYAAQPGFTTASWATSLYSMSLAVADLNGDKNLDLAVANYDNKTVSILLGNGLGGFGSVTNFGVSNAPYGITVGDFNGDQKLDLAVSQLYGNNVSVLLGDGRGGFGTATDFAVGMGPELLAVGDFNADQKLDLVVANIFSTNVSVLLGNGMGGFGTATAFEVGTSPRSVAVGDFNGDQKVDLAVTNEDTDSVSILLGNGLGGFGAAANFSVGRNPTSITLRDFNGDQKLDLAVTNYGSDKVSVLLGNGMGGFGASVEYAVGKNPMFIQVGDFNGDQELDLAVANLNSSNVSVLLGDGTGNFGGAINFAAGSGNYSLAVGDFNGDQKPDLAVASSNLENITILTNTSQ